MYVGRHMHLETEMVKWLALIALASAMVLAAATSVSGQESANSSEPKPLPKAIEHWAAPMDQTGGAMDEAEWIMAVQASAETWQLLELHHRGELETAKRVWQGTQLPCEREVWRFVALGVVHMQLGEWDRANEALDAAAGLEPDHALVHYYRGILWLTRADASIDWYDRVELGRTRLVGYVPTGDVPLPKGMCELAAMTEFEHAIANAEAIVATTALVDVPETDSALAADVPQVVPPTVGDLLTALGADNFVGKAHNVLGGLCLDHGALERAEQHMDGATASGLSVVDGYRELGAGYEAEGRTSDAARAYMKAMAHGGGVAWPAKKAFENLGKTLIQNW
ncbi:MAG: hypothetical protein KDA59_09410 [Planctomycetales bacterium]|nr:hypothetical protein [Planctomycetales bacterium]